MGKIRRKISPKKRFKERHVKTTFHWDATPQKPLMMNVSLVVNLNSKKMNVERILLKKIVGDETFYYVKWEGYGIDDATWEPEDHLTDCEPALKEFEMLSEYPNYPNCKNLTLNNFERKNIFKTMRVGLVLGKKIAKDPRSGRRRWMYNCTWDGFPIEVETLEPIEVINNFPGRMQVFERESQRLDDESELDMTDDEYENDYGST